MKMLENEITQETEGQQIESKFISQVNEANISNPMPQSITLDNYQDKDIIVCPGKGRIIFSAMSMVNNEEINYNSENISTVTFNIVSVNGRKIIVLKNCNVNFLESLSNSDNPAVILIKGEITLPQERFLEKLIIAETVQIHPAPDSNNNFPEILGIGSSKIHDNAELKDMVECAGAFENCAGENI